MKLRGKRVSLQVPDFDATIVGDRGEDRRGVRRPTDIVDLLLETANLVADQLAFTVLLMPDTNCPIVGASQEDGAEVGVPEGVTTHAINWAHMAVVVVGIALAE